MLMKKKIQKTYREKEVVQPLWKTVWQPLKCSHTVPRPGTGPRELLECPQKACAPMLAAGLFTVTKMQKQPGVHRQTEG